MDKNIEVKVKSNNIITIILFIALIIVTYLYFSGESGYKNKLKDIKHKHELIEDSLNKKINNLDSLYTNLETLNKNLSSDIDSLKNNQHDNEKPTLTPFHGLSSDSISSIFAGYDPNGYRHQ